MQSNFATLYLLQFLFQLSDQTYSNLKLASYIKKCLSNRKTGKTGLPTKDETLGTTVWNLISPFSYIQCFLQAKTGQSFSKPLKYLIVGRNQNQALNYFQSFGLSLQSHFLWEILKIMSLFHIYVIKRARCLSEVKNVSDG